MLSLRRRVGMIFQKPSLRTRVSFDMAMRHMGGDALYLSPNEIGLGKRESIADVARVLSGYVQALMARVFEHEHVLELAKWADIPVVNGLSDYNHPCQGMADALTIVEKFGAKSSTRIPRARAMIVSGAVLIPTASAPSRSSIRTSAGVSYVGPRRPA